MQLPSVFIPLLGDAHENMTSYGWNSTGDLTVPDIPYTYDNMFVEPNSNFTNSFGINTTSIVELTTKSSVSLIRGKMPKRPYDKALVALLKTLDQTVVPVALSFGIMSNMLIFPIFAYTPLRYSALSHYLAAIGISDLLYLVSNLIVWVSQHGFGIYNSIGVCQITNFFLRLSRFLATWYLFAAHVERVLVHFSSFRASEWCSTFRTKFIILFIFVFSLVGFIHNIWTHVVTEINGKPQCRIMHESVTHFRELGKIETIAASFLPMVLIIVIDIALLVSTIIRRYQIYFRVPSKNDSVKNDRGQDDLGDYVLAPGKRSGSIAHNRHGESSSLPPEMDLSLEIGLATITVVIIGIIFIGLLLPSTITTAKILFMPDKTPSLNEMFTMKLFEHLVTFNSVYKFLLYLIFLGSFRHGLIYLFRCNRKRKPAENRLQETTEV